MLLPTLATHHPVTDITAAPARYQRGRLFIGATAPCHTKPVSQQCQCLMTSQTHYQLQAISRIDSVYS